ncbi:hypothetical protein ACU686_14895 [Yinghuangia aomiensis]
MVKNNHSSHRLDVDTRLVTVGTALTAAGSIVALTGLALTASALLGAARKMIPGYGNLARRHGGREAAPSQARVPGGAGGVAGGRGRPCGQTT